MHFCTRHVSALNGMANVYSFHRDYDRAIELGTLAASIEPAYGEAAWDLAISLEGKLNQAGPKIFPHFPYGLNIRGVACKHPTPYR
jgi:hypothetical protein